MSFNLENTITDMTSAISGIVSNEWPGIKDCIKKALDDEKIALEAALLACKVKAKVMAQNAANAAIDVLKEAIKAAT